MNSIINLRKSKYIGLVLFFILSIFLTFSCTDDNSCKDGFHKVGNSCTADCTLDYCAIISQNCSEVTKECEPWCKEDTDCENNQFCDRVYQVCVPTLNNELKSCVKQSLNQEESDKLTLTQLNNIHTLECVDMGITNIDGISSMKNLSTISLWENKIEDISELSKLTKLTKLQLGFNNISDITPLKELKELKVLSLEQNQISDITTIDNFSNLKWLNLDGNLIDSADNLKLLTNLKWLSIEHNNISSLDFVESLESNGCEVYDGSDTLNKKSQFNIKDLFISDKINRIKKLSFDIDNHKLTLYIKRGTEKSHIRLETGGSLYKEKDLVIYKTKRKSSIIGTIEDDNIKLCKGKYSNICKFMISEKSVGNLLNNSNSLYTAYIEIFRNKTKSVDEAIYFDKMNRFVLAAPNQADAGSCLFMANTGAVEIVTNQHTDKEIKNDGETDFSERYLMNASNFSQDIEYTMTDLSYTFNSFNGGLLNKDYPFTVGYVIEDDNGNKSRGEKGEEGASLSAAYNWFNDMPSDWKNLVTETPKIERTILFIDPDLNKNSIWNLGIVNSDVIERIKYELRTKNAPVVVIYNHYLYWHTDIIVGYDDNFELSEECPMVKDSIEYFKEKDRDSYAQKIQKHMAKEGGCSKTGVFYVRDSIYDGGEEEATYYYGGDEHYDKYSKRIILHSYDWVKYLGNHVYSIHRK